MRRRKYISCQIFKPYIQRILSRLDAPVDMCALDIQYVDIEAHNEPQKLRTTLQGLIDANQDKDEIILLYGICGNAVEGLVSERSKLILFRVHDCLAVLLGSNERYRHVVEEQRIGSWKCEGNHSVYLELHDRRYLEYVSQYGEDNARYLMSILHPEDDRVVYVSFGTEGDQENMDTLRDSKDVLVLEGDMGLLEDMILQKEKDMIVEIGAGKLIHCVYDYDIVLQELQTQALGNG